MKENYAAGQSWVDLGTYPDKDGNDQLFGFFYNVNVKSLVWYVPENFEDAGYEVPETMEELKALTDQIVADGETPWCIGLGSGAATGDYGSELTSNLADSLGDRMDQADEENDCDGAIAIVLMGSLIDDVSFVGRVGGACGG